MEADRKTTRVYRVDPAAPDPIVIETAAAVLRRGGLVAFPTETVYGLGANALDPAAVEKIFAAKGRPPDNPLIAHIADRANLDGLVRRVSPEAGLLMERFWPGPLTLVLPRNAAVPAVVSAGLPTVAVRMPDHPVARALIRAAGVPLAAPSANTSGKPSPTEAAHVLSDLRGRIEAILDGGPCEVGVESTVVDLSGPVPVLLRPGGVTLEDLERVLPQVETAPELGAEIRHPLSPGMKYTHYKPSAEVLLVAGAAPAVAGKMEELVQQQRREGKRVGLLVTAELGSLLDRDDCRPDFLGHLGSRCDLTEAAFRLFGLLRECDQKKLDIVLAEALPETGIGLAVMNRLRKAAGYRILQAGQPD